MQIWVALTDDWELRGNGTGRVEDLQERPALELMNLYEKLGVRATFNVEVLQQLAFERYSDTNDVIKRGREAWIRTVAAMVTRGFDVQLHLHPQWWGAELIDGWWKLGRRWNIADYSAEEIQRMLDAALGYLRPLVGSSQIVSFRGGSWSVGPPSRPLFLSLAERGIRLDVSIVQGVYYDGEGIKLDYRHLDSPYLAYRPDIDDGRRLASPNTQNAIIEIPTQAVTRGNILTRLTKELNGSRRREALQAIWQLVRGWHVATKTKSILRSAARGLRSRQGREIPDFVLRDPFGFISGKAKTDVIFDLSSQYAPILFERMIDICIERARSSSGRELAILILQNHTKDLQSPADFQRIERTVSHIQRRHPVVEFHTLQEVSHHLHRIA